MSASKLTYKGKTIGPAKIRLYGQMGPLGLRQKEACLLGKNIGAKSLCSILPDDGEHPEAWYKVVEHYGGKTLHAEAIILRNPGEGVVFTSRDCPITTFINKINGEIGVAHVGKQSLMKANSECESCEGGVLENLFASMNLPDGKNMTVYVTGGISARNYTGHDADTLRNFARRFGPKVVKNLERGEIDLLAAIRVIAMRYGIPNEQVFSDQLCTFETPWLGSRRAKKDGSNWTYVIKVR